MKKLLYIIVLFSCYQLVCTSSLQAQALTGIKTVGGPTPDYANITLAVAALNTNGVGAGGVIFNIAAGYSDTVVNLIVSAVGTAANPIVFKKNGVGVNPVLYGIKGAGTTDAIITLSGTRYVTFDGIDVMDSTTGGTATTQMEFGYYIINSSVTFGSCKNTIKNCSVTLRRTNTASMGIFQKAVNTPTSLSGSNHNNRYENIHIQNCYNGILLTTAALYPDSNNVITSSGSDSTIIGANTPNDIGNGAGAVTGIQCQNQKNVEVSKCVLRNFSITGIQVLAGIWINNINLSPNFGNAMVYSNTLYNFTRTNSGTLGTLSGIRVDLAPSATATVFNNIVYSMHQSGRPATATATVYIRGISHGTATGTGNAFYYNNSVSINDTVLNTSSAAFWKSGTGTVTLRNNIFSNTTANQVVSDPAKHYACYVSGSVISSSNVLWAPNANGFIGYATGDRSDLSLFASAISGPAPTDGNELGSANANPNFISETNLRIGANSPVVGSGTAIASPLITTDILGVARNTAKPSIGAFETTYLLTDSSAPMITNVSIGTKSVGGNSLPVIYATIYDNNDTGTVAGSVALWYRLGTSGAFTSAAPDSIPLNHMNGTYKWDSAFNYIVPGTYQFYIAARDKAGEGLHIAVNPIQDLLYAGFSVSDPANYLYNPNVSTNTRTFDKLTYLAGGTYTVGPSGTYPKLKDAANALATSWITGDIIIELQNDYDGTTGEIFPITFPQLSTIGGDWSVIVRPAINALAKETSGIAANGVPLIKLNGIKKITFDGRPGGIGTTSEWMIRNKTTGITGSANIQFINGAQYDTLRYLKLESSASTGTVTFATSASAGNKYNMISDCTIGDRSDMLSTAPTIGILSTGTAGILNDSNTIVNNKIYNYGSYGINITETGNGNRWIVDGNHFYNSLISFQYTPSPSVQIGISITAPATSGHIVQNNFIGGSQAFCGGTIWENPSSAGWRGVTMNVAAGTDSSYIRNNTIQNVTAPSGIYALWALEITNGTVSINNNMIGHPTDPNSIISGLNTLFTGLSIQTGTGNVAVYDNTFANLASISTTSTIGTTGIQCTVNGNIRIVNNRFYSFSSTGIATSRTASSVRAMLCTGAATYLIDNNTIHDLSCTGGPSNTTATGSQGIVVTGGSGIIRNNRIYGLTNTTANVNGQVNGINISGSNWDIYNNAISLGYNVDSSVTLTGMLIATTGTTNLFYNTVSIKGAYIGLNTAQTSAALNRTSSSTIHVRNNIFSNTHTGYAANYAIANTNATPATGWNANYNDLYASNALQLGLWNTSATNLAAWKSTSLFDTSSVSAAPSFTSNTDLQLTAPSVGSFSFAGRPLTAVTTDINGQPRNTIYPYLGAFENTANPLPVSLLTIQAIPSYKDVYVTWATASEINSDVFVVERSFDQHNFKYAGSVNASGNSNKVLFYSFTDKEILANTTSKVIYYRLKMVDQDGKFAYSDIVSVNVQNDQPVNMVTLSPNPFNTDLMITVVAVKSGTASVTISDITGTETLKFDADLVEGINTVYTDKVSTLKNGLYFVAVELEGERYVMKLVKE